MLSQQMQKFHAFLAGYEETESIPPASIPIDLTTLTEGAVAVVDLANMPIVSNAALVAAQKFRLVQNLGDRLQYSPVLTYADCVFTSNKHITATEQVTTIGYNGTSGTFPAANSTSYYIYVEKNDNDEAHRSGQWPSITAQWETTASASQIASAIAAANSLFVNSLLEAEVNPTNGGPRYIDIYVTSAGADTGANTTATVSFNGKKITVASATGIDVGGSLRFTLANGQKDTYLVEAIDGTTVTLTTPWRHASASGLAVREVTNFATTDCGVRLIGLPSKFNVNATPMWMKNRFTVKILSAGTSTGSLLTTSTEAKEGVGNWQQVALEEKQSWMNFGHLYHTSPPYEPLPSEVVNGAYYSAIVIQESTAQKDLLTTGNFKQVINLWLQLKSDKTLPNGSSGDFLADVLLGSAFTAGDLDA